jgi:hypothetical protein
MKYPSARGRLCTPAAAQHAPAQCACPALGVCGGDAIKQIAPAGIGEVAEIAKGATRRLAVAASDDGGPGRQLRAVNDHPDTAAFYANQLKCHLMVNPRDTIPQNKQTACQSAADGFAVIQNRFVA